MKQYEERFKRLSDHLETGNQTYQKAQEDLKRLKLSTEQSQQARDQFLNQLLERSNALKAKVIKLASDKGKQVSAKSVLAEVDAGAAQFLSLKTENDWVSIEVRDHFLDLYQRGVTGLIKRQ